MPVRYNYLPRENVIDVECFGELTIQEITTYFADIAQDDSIPKGATEFVDLTRVTYFNVDHIEAATMPAHYSPTQLEKEITATILFGSTPINMGLSQLIEAYFRKYMPEHLFQIVDSRANALQILSYLGGDSVDSAREA